MTSHTSAARDTPNITDFYHQKTIFITGATGFIGKALLEKFLRSFETVGTIYLLVRAKKGATNDQRLAQIFDSEIFHGVFAQRP